MRVQQAAEPDLGCHMIVPLASGYRLALRAWGFHPTLYLDVPDEVSAQAVARFLSGREGLGPSPCAVGWRIRPAGRAPGQAGRLSTPHSGESMQRVRICPAHPVTSRAAGDYGANEQSDNVVS